MNFPTDIFGEEACAICGQDAEPLETDMGSYVWHCTVCDIKWVEPSSVMDIFNDLHYETFKDRYEGF